MALPAWIAAARLAAILPVALAIVALAIRLYGLTYHSLWFDEVVSTMWAARPAAEIWRVGLALVQDKHPPLYYLMLRGWTLAFGPGDFAVRSLGVLLGALAALPIYGIGRILGGRRAAAVAALLLALNPFLVWYSQEARMFMPAATFLLLALYGLLLLWEGDASPPAARRLAAGWLLLALGLTAALYTYLFSALMLPVAGAWALLLWWQGRHSRRAGTRLALALSALAATALLFFPLARSAWSVSGTESTPGRAFAGMGPALAGLLRVYTIGWPRWPAPWPAIVTAAAAALALAGLAVADGRRPGRAAAASSPVAEDAPAAAGGRCLGLLLAVWIILPAFAGGLLLARDRTVFAESRYFIFLVPALCLAWGRGLAAAWEHPRTAWGSRPPQASGAWLRPASALPLLATIVVLAMALPWLWRPENRREDWRAAAALLAAQAGPADAILVQPDYVSPALARYFRGTQPVFQPFTGTLDDPAQVDPPLAGLHGFDAVWLVQSHHEAMDPGNLVAGWFGARFPLATEVYPPGIAIRSFLQRYRTPGLPAEAASGRVDLQLGALRLLACRYTPERLPAQDTLLHPPSGWVHVSTYWTVSATPAAGIIPAVRLVDAAGQVWGDRLERPSGAFRVWPTSRWQPGEVVRADDDVNLNPATPPGAYRLVVQVPGAADALCGKVQITAPGAP